MMDMDEPLDFESEDSLLIVPVTTRKRKKVIGLDDLLFDHYKEKSKLIERESKEVKVKKRYDSEEEEDDKETILTECVDECQKKMGQIGGEDELPLWGLQFFGNQKTAPPLTFPQKENCVLLHSFLNNEFNLLVELSNETGETFLEGLLVDGWLLKLVYSRGHVEKSIALWTFNLVLYSSKEVLRASACDFWCAILSPKHEGDPRCIKIDWLPSYIELKRVLETYGFLFDSPVNTSFSTEMVNGVSGHLGPPQSIRALIKYLAACSQARSARSIFSTSEAEELVVVVICLFLDRRLLGLSVILNECLLSVVSFFTNDEWDTSCEKVAKSIACRVPKDVNCLRTVESISGVNARSKHLRSAVAFHFLITCFSNKVVDAEEILRLLISINVKGQSCDLFMVYIYLGLMENWFLCNIMLENKRLLFEMWGIFLRQCSCQITGTDLRSHASKVRSKASYLLQSIVNK